MDSNGPKDLRDLALRLRLALSRSIWKLGPRRLDKPPSVLVISPGGVASTLVIQQVARHVDVNSASDRDGLKHLPRRPNNSVRALLITGDASAVTASLSRRGYLGIHCSKLGNPLGVLAPLRIQEAIFRREILQQRKSFSRSRHPTLVIEYDELWDDIGRIASFLSLEDTSFCEDFPAKTKRRNLR